jgi:magnesium transporter
MPWHDIRDPQDPELDRVAALYHLHPLHVEDCRHRNQSAKIEENGAYIFAVLKPVRVLEDGGLETSDLDIIAGRDFIITVEEIEWPATRQLLDKILPGDRADQLFYRITDAVIDSYLPLLDYFDDLIDSLEDEVLDRPTPSALSRLFDTKRSLIELRRILVNTRDVAGHLQRSESPLIGRDMWPFLRDIYDHVIRVNLTIDTARDTVTTAIQVNLAMITIGESEVTKRLAAYAALVAVPTMIAGIYGMTFEHMPELEWTFGYPLTIALMAALDVWLWWRFRKAGWL